MRPLEVLVAVTAAAALVAAVVGRPRALRLLAAPVAVLAVGLHLVVEGPRGAMVVAYALVAALALVRMGRPDRLGRAGRAGVAGCGAVGLAAAIALPVAVPVFTFPRPTGPHGVGTLTYHWVDAGRPEILSADPAARREVVVQVWYPAEDAPGAARAPYVADAASVGPAMAHVHGLPAFVLGGMGSVVTNAVDAAPAVGPAHPVVVFLEGLTGYRQMNTFQVEELVSHGYAVVAIDQPYVASRVEFPDGHRTDMLPVDLTQALLQPSISPVAPAPRLHGRPFDRGSVPHLAADVGFVLDRLAEVDRSDPQGVLTGRLDLSRTGVFGVSMGGIVGAEACRTEPRLRACLVVDAPMPREVVRHGLDRPTLWVSRDVATMQREGWDPADIDEHQDSMRAVFDTLRADGYLVRVPGAFHADFTDLPRWVPLLSPAGFAGPIGTARAHRIVNAWTVAFFDRHLAGAPAPLLDDAAAHAPEVVVETHRG